jgi:hypothetical protein
VLAGVLSLRGLEQQQVVRSFAHPGAVRFGRIVGLCCCRRSLFPRVPECYALFPLRGDGYVWLSGFRGCLLYGSLRTSSPLDAGGVTMTGRWSVLGGAGGGSAQTGRPCYLWFCAVLASYVGDLFGSHRTLLAFVGLEQAHACSLCADVSECQASSVFVLLPR